MAFSLSAGRLQDTEDTEGYEKTYKKSFLLQIHNFPNQAAPIHTKQSTSHCMGMRRGREKLSDLLASGWACFCFCNASPSINRTD